MQSADQDSRYHLILSLATDSYDRVLEMIALAGAHRKDDSNCQYAVQLFSDNEVVSDEQIADDVVRFIGG